MVLLVLAGLPLLRSRRFADVRDRRLDRDPPRHAAHHPDLAARCRRRDLWPAAADRSRPQHAVVARGRRRPPLDRRRRTFARSVRCVPRVRRGHMSRASEQVAVLVAASFLITPYTRPAIRMRAGDLLGRRAFSRPWRAGCGRIRRVRCVGVAVGRDAADPGQRAAVALRTRLAVIGGAAREVTAIAAPALAPQPLGYVAHGAIHRRRRHASSRHA